MNLKKSFQSCAKLLRDRDYRFIVLANLGFYRNMEDEAYLKRRFRAKLGKELNLDEPKTYNEKLQWLKLHDRKPIYTELVDKYEVRRHIAAAIGEEYLIKLVGGPWNSFDEIDFDSLPDQFVLKCTHDSGGLVICKDKSKLDKAAAKKKIQRSLKCNYYYSGREWPYKNVPPRIIAEAYMEDEETGELRDYKFFCFSGEPKALFIASQRQTAGEETKFDFFDMDYNHLDVRNGHPNAAQLPEKPARFDTMRDLARKLAADYPQIRVDFYEVNGKVYFGELTLFHWSGLVPFEPEQWDTTFGSWIELPDGK